MREIDGHVHSDEVLRLGDSITLADLEAGKLNCPNPFSTVVPWQIHVVVTTLFATDAYQVLLQDEKWFCCW
jgi:hypothetical protein